MPKPIIPWMGGKRRLVKQILPIFPEHHTYVEPFCGGAAMFFSKDNGMDPSTLNRPRNGPRCSR